MNLALKKILTLVGCFLYSMCLVGPMIWPNIIIYVISYYKIESNSDLTYADGNITMPMLAISNNFALIIGFFLALKIGLKLIIFIIAILSPILVFACAILKNFTLFVLLYSLGYGFISGISIVPVMFSSI